VYTLVFIFGKTITMKGVQIFFNEKQERSAVLIDWQTLQQHQAEVEDLLDALLAESYLGEESVTLEEARVHLQSLDKL
jgi:hypothetical protein